MDDHPRVSEAREQIPEEQVASVKAAPFPPLEQGHGAAAGVALGLQRSVGNRATARWAASAHRRLQRQQVDELQAYIADADWARAAWALGKLSDDDLRARVTKMSTTQRQRVIEGARHSEPAEWVAKIVTIMMDIDARSALVGSIRWGRWKHEWQRTAGWFTALDPEDGRRVAFELDFSWDDLQAVAGTSLALNLMFFSKPEWVQKWRRERVSAKDAPGLAVSWLLTNPVVAPYAKTKFGGGLRPTVTLVSDDNWSSTYARAAAGELDPKTGRPKSEEQLRNDSVFVNGYTTDDDRIYLHGGRNKPETVIHEAVHSLAPGDVRDRLGKPVNEGMTEFFARQVAATAGQHPGTSYPDETAGVKALVDMVGQEPVAAALFAGKIFALEDAVNAKVSDGFGRWKQAMNDPDQIKHAADALKPQAAPQPAGVSP